MVDRREFSQGRCLDSGAPALVLTFFSVLRLLAVPGFSESSEMAEAAELEHRSELEAEDEAERERGASSIFEDGAFDCVFSEDPYEGQPCVYVCVDDGLCSSCNQHCAVQCTVNTGRCLETPHCVSDCLA